jgi:hypothetical protein
MTMLYRLLADAVVVLHLGFVGFVVLGGLLVLRWPRAAWVHLPTAVWGVWVEFTGRICPLTPLENWLSRQGGGAPYSASFVEHYLIPVLYPAVLTRELQWALGGLVLAVNAAVYAAVLLRHRSRSVFYQAERASVGEVSRAQRKP